MLERLVGLPEVRVIDLHATDDHVELHIESIAAPPGCAVCGVQAQPKGWRVVVLTDLPFAGKTTPLHWQPRRWLMSQSQPWRDGVAWATLDLSGAYKAVFDACLPDATQVADKFLSSWLTSASTRRDAGSKTRPWATGAGRTTRCIGSGGSSPWPRSASGPKVT